MSYVSQYDWCNMTTHYECNYFGWTLTVRVDGDLLVWSVVNRDDPRRWRGDIPYSGDGEEKYYSRIIEIDKAQKLAEDVVNRYKNTTFKYGFVPDDQKISRAVDCNLCYDCKASESLLVDAQTALKAINNLEYKLRAAK